MPEDSATASTLSAPVIALSKRVKPTRVRIDIGHALFTAQEGGIDPAAKPLKGFGGASVLEIVASHHGNAWRAVYTVRFEDAIYVLHVFQNKSTKGIATRTREIELIKQRLAEAIQSSKIVA